MKKQSSISTLALTLGGIINNCYAMPPDGFRDDLLDAVASVSAYLLEFEAIAPSDSRGWPIDHQIIALKRPNSIYDYSGKSFSGGRVWQDDPQQHRFIISRNREYSELPLRRSFRVTETDDKRLFPEAMADYFIWTAITWWPITRQSNHRLAEPFVVLDVLESEEYQFRKELEDVGEVECWVLESPGRSVLWFDAKRIGVLMARESYGKDTGEPQWRIEMTKHKEIKPGIWCPMELRNIQYDINAPTEEDRKQMIVDATFKVLDVRVNEEVPDELFEIPEPKPGTIQDFEDGTSKQIVPGGYDYLDDIEDWVERNIKFKESVSNVSVAEIACYVVGIVISLYIIYWCWKSRRAGIARVIV